MNQLTMHSAPLIRWPDHDDDYLPLNEEKT